MRRDMNMEEERHVDEEGHEHGGRETCTGGGT